MTVAHYYFQSHQEYFWELHYSDIGYPAYIFEIPNGGTIAYANWVEEVIEFLSDQSLPPFGSLLLAIAATNYEPQGSLNSIKQILKAKEVKRAFPNVNLYNVDSAFGFLSKLVQLPIEYKSEDKRKLLFQTIFKDCHNRVSRDNSKAIVKILSKDSDEFYYNTVVNPFNESVFHKDIKTLSLLNNSFPTVNSIIKAMEGLPDTEVTEELESEIANQEIVSKEQKDFVDELIENNKTFHVGSLMKRLWSGLKIPLHHNLPSNQPLGGISDITNKGDFDKLLISEFANDDLVFMSRIANNEALYIEREVPPEEDKFTRDIIIDSSIKNWGNPKTIAFAIGLAIAKHPKSDINCQLFVVGDECNEVEFETVHQVIDGLNLLSGKLDASVGLTQYFEQERGDAEKEVFLVLSEDSFKLPAFQKVVHENFDAIHYIFLTSVDGGITFFKIANKGKKLIQKMQLPLDELWTRESKHKYSEPTLEENAPLLYPFAPSQYQVFHNQAVHYCFFNGSLFEFSVNPLEKGLNRIAFDIPFKNGKYALKEDSKNEKILFNIFDTEDSISVYNLSRRTIRIIKFPFVKKVYGLELFTYKNNVYLTDHICYWNINNTGGFIESNDFTTRKAYENYRSQLGRFLGEFKVSNKKMSIIRKLREVEISINHRDIKINDFSLLNGRFRKNRYNRFHLNNNFLYTTPYVNLILKRCDTNKIEIIKLIKEELMISLKEAKEIIDGHLSVIANGISVDFADELKEKIEEKKAICYYEIAFFRTNDGSKISLNDGILEFESSSSSIPKFFIPFITNQPIAMASATDFAGNNYFIGEDSKLNLISEDEFRANYFYPFIRHIVDNDTND